MVGEPRESNLRKKIESEKEAGEDILHESFFRKKFPLTYKNTKKDKNSLEKFTSEIKKIEEKGVEEYLNEYPEFIGLYPSKIKEMLLGLPKTLNKLDEYVKERGFKKGALAGRGELIGPILPFNFFQIGMRKLVNYQYLESFAPSFAKEGIALFVGSQGELLKGKALEAQKEFFTKNEELLKLGKSGKLKNEKERLEELGKLVALVGNSARKQHIEKLRKEKRDIAETIAALAVFSDIVIFGTKGPSLFKMKDTEGAKKYLSLGYPDLEERTIDQILEKGKKIRKDLEEKYRYEKEGGIAYA
jgi:hypothetical protein